MFGLIILLAMCIGALKVSHDDGNSKIYFIIGMLISVFCITQDWIAIALFMAPLAFYVQGTGAFHKANKNSRHPGELLKEVGWVDYIVRRPISYLLENYSQFFKTWASWHLYGFIYCLICSLIFSLPFIYTNYLYSLPLFLWAFTVRNITYGIKPGGSEWWWINTFILFFGYSALYLLSINN